jgi:O-antigen/teichoic acid export membrane protein
VSGYTLQYLSVPLAIASSIYLLRSLAVAEYGILALLLATNLYLSVFSHLGMSNAIVRYLSEYRREGRHRDVWGLIGWALLLRYGTLALALGVVTWTITPIATLLGAPLLAEYLPVFALFIVIDTGVQVWAAVLEALLLQAYISGVQVVFAGLKLGLLVAFLGSGAGLRGAIWALIVANAVLLVLYAGRAMLTLWPASGGRGLRGEGRRLFRYCGSWYFGKLSSLVFDRSTDLYLVTFFLGSEAAGLYAFASNIANQTLRFLSPSPHLWSALMPAAVAAGGRDGGLLALVFRFTTKAVVFFSIPVIAAVFVAGDKGIAYVFGARYVPAALVFTLWTATAFLGELEQPIRMLMAVKERVSALFVNRVMIVYNLGAAVLLIPVFGIEGAIFATASTALFAFVILVSATRRHHPVPFPWGGCAPVVFNSVLMAGFLYVMRPWVAGLPSLVAACVLAAALYITLTRFWGPFEQSEIALVCRLLPPRSHRAVAWLVSRP